MTLDRACLIRSSLRTWWHSIVLTAIDLINEKIQSIRSLLASASSSSSTSSSLTFPSSSSEPVQNQITMLHARIHRLQQNWDSPTRLAVNAFHSLAHNDGCGFAFLTNCSVSRSELVDLLHFIFRCKLTNSIRQVVGAGRATGEEVEQTWSWLNWLVSMIRDASPHRRMQIISQRVAQHTLGAWIRSGGMQS